MAKLTVGQKAQRVLRLLLGMRNARIAGALGRYGFTQADLDEGWARLRALTDDRLAVPPPPGPVDPSLLERLDVWENRWFPVASASLRTRYSEVHDWLFLNLQQTSGQELVLSVGTFVERVGAMATQPELGEQGAAARALLEKRGLDAAQIAEAQALLDKLGVTAPAPAAPPLDPAAIEAAEDHMWNWYLEWSQIARVAVTNRRLLRQLGFLRSSSSRSTSDDEDELDEDDELDDEALGGNGVSAAGAQA